MANAVGEVAINLTADIAPLQRELNRGAAATKQFAERAGAMGGAMAVSSNQARLMAQQLSQVGQQTMATGNFVQALAIQLPDLGLAFGAAGAAAGLLAGIALPMVVAAFSSTGDEAKALQKSLENMTRAVDAYATAAAAAGAPTEDLRAKYGAMAEEARAGLQALSDVAQVEAVDAVKAALDGAVASLITMQEKVTLADDGFSKSVETVMVLNDSFGMTVGQVDQLRGALSALASAQGLDVQAQAANDVRVALLSAFGSVEAMPGPLREAYKAMAQIAVKSAEAKELADQVSGATRAIADAADAAAAAMAGIGAAASGVLGQVQALATAAWDFAGAMGAAERERQAAATASSRNYGKLQNEYGSGPDAARASVMGLNAPGLPQMGTGAAGIRNFASGVGGGGGGGGGDDLQAELDAMRARFGDTAAVAEEEYQKQIDQLRQFRDAKLVAEEEYNALEQQITRDHQKALMDIQGEAMNEKLSAYSSAFGDLASLMDSGNKKMFAVGKAAAIAQATIDGYQAAVSAWKSGMQVGGPATAAAFTALSLAKTGGLIASIGSTSANGGGGGGGGRGGFSGGAVGGASPAPPQQFANITITGDTVNAGTLVDEINRLLGLGYTINGLARA